MARKLDGSSNSGQSDGSDGPDGGTGRSSLLARRSYLKLSSAAAALVSVASGTVVGRPTTSRGGGSTVGRGGIEFDRVLDAVEDLGMDPTGERPVDDPVRDAGDGTLVRFPDGEYRFDGIGVRLDGETRGFEAVGTDATFLAPDGRQGFLLDGQGMPGAYVDGIDVDQTGSGTAAGLRLCGEHTVVEDVTFRGRSDSASDAVGMIGSSTPAPDGTTRIEDVRYVPAGTTGQLRIVGDGSITNYEFTVGGAIERSGGANRGYDSSGANAEGAVRSGDASYAFSGDIEDARVDGTATVYVDDRRVDPDAIASGSGRGSSSRLRIDGGHEETSYRLNVGDSAPSSVDGTSIERGGTVTDAIGLDAEEFPVGGIRRLQVQGVADVQFDHPS